MHKKWKSRLTTYGWSASVKYISYQYTDTRIDLCHQNCDDVKRVSFFLCASSRCASGWFRNIRHRTRSSHLVIVAVAAAANDPFYCSEFNLSNFKQLVHDWAIHSQWTHTNTFLFKEREHSSASSKPQIGCLVDRNMRKCDKVCVRARILSSINMSTVFFCFCLFKCCGQCWPDFHIDYEYAIVNDWK